MAGDLSCCAGMGVVLSLRIYASARPARRTITNLATANGGPTGAAGEKCGGMGSQSRQATTALMAHWPAMLLEEDVYVEVAVSFRPVTAPTRTEVVYTLLR